MKKSVTVIDKKLLTALSQTYVRPHRHPSEDRWEFFQIVSGSAVIVTFDQQGTVLEKIVLSLDGPNVAIEIPGNLWHTIASLRNGTVLLEIKKGPYEPVSDKDFANWAPVEGSSQAERFVQWFCDASPGDSYPRG